MRVIGGRVGSEWIFLESSFDAAAEISLFSAKVSPWPALAKAFDIATHLSPGGAVRSWLVRMTTFFSFMSANSPVNLPWSHEDRLTLLCLHWKLTELWIAPEKRQINRKKDRVNRKKDRIFPRRNLLERRFFTRFSLVLRARARETRETGLKNGASHYALIAKGNVCFHSKAGLAVE